MQNKPKINLETISIDKVENLVRENMILYFELIVTTPFATKIFKTKTSLNQVYEYLESLLEQKFRLLLISNDDIFQLAEFLKNKITDHRIAINIVNKVFQEILMRKDLITLKRTLELLGLIQAELQFDYDTVIPVAQRTRGFLVSQELSITAAYTSSDYDIIAFTLANESQMHKFGKIWNLIEPEVLGQFKVYRRKKIDQLVNYDCIFEKTFHFRTNCLEFVFETQEFYLGNCEGKLLTFKFDNQFIKESRCASIIPHPIFKMKLFLPNEIYLIGEKILKIIDPITLQIIGGGSLKSRLGTSMLYSLGFEKQRKILILGDSAGRIHLYRRTLQNIDFISTLELSTSIPVNSIYTDNDFMFICCNQNVSVMKIQENGLVQEVSCYSLLQKQFKIESSIQDFIFLKQQKCGLAILQEGSIIQWKAQTGEINQALKISEYELNLMIYSHAMQTLLVTSIDGMVHFIDFNRAKVQFQV